ncbi:MFS transporter [Peribacillus simplex]|uniref:MFS transporter n=1 Tax=Peribacillus simplex TaxID=1478 RepID=UPI003D265DB1
MKTLFSNRPFMIVMASDLLQNIGIWIRNMSLLFFVVERTNGSPIAISILTIIEYLPILIFSIIGGVLADRWIPKRTMILGDILSFISIIFIIIVVESGHWQAVFLVTAVSTIVSQFSQPSSMKLIKQNVEEKHIPSAIAFSQSLMSLFVIIGPIIGTSIYQYFGIERVLISLLIIFAFSALILSFLPRTEKVKYEKNETAIGDLKAGIMYVAQSKNLQVLMLIYAILAVGVGLVQPLDVFIVIDRLALEMENLKWFTALSGVGMLIGAGIAALISKKIKGHLVIFTGFFFLGIATIIEVWSIWPLLTGAIRFLTGIFLAFIQTILATLMLMSVQESYIGRINGLITPIFTGSLLIGTSISGLFMEMTSIITVFMTAGLIIILAAIVSLKLKTENNTQVEKQHIL